MTEILQATLERCLDSLQRFRCPDHHRDQYERTEAALAYLLRPGNLERVVLVEQPTFAPICADMAPDSGVCFLRNSARGPRDLASAMEQGALSGNGLFQHLWEDALGVEFPTWQETADRAPVIFVRLGESACTDGRWHWKPLLGENQAVTYPDVEAAFAALIAEAETTGAAEHARRLWLWRHGILEEEPSHA
jgi:hypothetical protein